MKDNKSSVKLVFIGFALFIATTGCSMFRYTAPNEPEWTLSTLKTENPAAIRISIVDGQKASGTLNNSTSWNLPDTVKIAPGPHKIVPCLIDGNDIVSGEKISFYSQAGQTYVLRYKVKWDKTARFWIENNGVDITTEE
jgi:hypothetical protein